MTPAEALATLIRPALAILGGPFAGREAECMLLAIGLQESGFRVRVQDRGGPAHGFWQFEPGSRGGIRRVASAGDRRILEAIVRLGYPLDDAGILYEGPLYRVLAIPKGDRIACFLARGLLWMIPAPLPTLGDEEEAWLQYEHQWGPGKPDRARWADAYPQALAAVRA